MAGRQVQWRHRPPTRALGRVGWTALVAALVLAPVWLLFEAEPRRADSGAVNPFALVIPLLAVLFGALLGAQTLALVRRPTVGADHYALTLRPGIVRTLVLPWAEIAELATIVVDDEPLLLVRCLPVHKRSADWPRWWDQAQLRSARRATTVASSYHLAVPIGDFVDPPRALLAELTQWAPDRVTVSQRGRYPA